MIKERIESAIYGVELAAGECLLALCGAFDDKTGPELTEMAKRGLSIPVSIRDKARAELHSAIGFGEDDANYKVIKRFQRPKAFITRDAYLLDPNPSFRGLFVDVETTGLDTQKDRIIEFGVVPFLFDESGIRFVTEPFSWLEDPGIPIPEVVTQLTGLAYEDVKGYRINDAAVSDLVGKADLIIAHNAGYDRPIVERRFPDFASHRWACSQKEVPWDRITGQSGTKLDYLLFKALGEFATHHRAVDDCLVGLHLLASCKWEGKTAFQWLYESSQTDTVRVWARNAPFEVKDALKARGYHWDAAARVWNRDIAEAALEAENQFLKALYGGNPRIERITALTRYQSR